MRLIETAEYCVPRELSVSFTGHRPTALPWGWDAADARCEEFRRRLRAEISRAYDEGARYFLSGMAFGVDTIAAEEVLKFRYFHPSSELIAVFPHFSGVHERARRIAESANTVLIIGDERDRDVYRKRNQFLIDHSIRLIAGFSGDWRTGTGMTMRMAERAGVRTIIIDL